MIPQCHGWGWFSPQTPPYIHIRHIQSVWDIDILSQGHMVAPLYHYTAQVGPRSGDSGSLDEWKWCHNVMAETDIHLRPLHTFILDTFKVFEQMVCFLTGIWLHPYTITPWFQIWGFRVTCGVKMMLSNVWCWYSPQITAYIHIRHEQSVWDIGVLSQGHMVAPLYLYTGKVGPSFGKSASLDGWKWCHNVMVEVDIHLRPLHTSILDMYKVFELLVRCLNGIWFHPFTVTPAKLPQIWGFSVTCGVKMMPQRHGWGWYLLQTASYIHIRHIQSVWAVGVLSQGPLVAPLYQYIAQVGPRFGDSGSLVLVEWKWCYLTSCLRLISSSDNFIHPH